MINSVAAFAAIVAVSEMDRSMMARKLSISSHRLGKLLTEEAPLDAHEVATVERVHSEYLLTKGEAYHSAYAAELSRNCSAVMESEPSPVGATQTEADNGATVLEKHRLVGHRKTAVRERARAPIPYPLIEATEEVLPSTLEAQPPVSPRAEPVLAEVAPVSAPEVGEELLGAIFVSSSIAAFRTTTRAIVFLMDPDSRDADVRAVAIDPDDVEATALVLVGNLRFRFREGTDRDMLVIDSDKAKDVFSLNQICKPDSLQLKLEPQSNGPITLYRWLSGGEVTFLAFAQSLRTLLFLPLNPIRNHSNAARSTIDLLQGTGDRDGTRAIFELKRSSEIISRVEAKTGETRQFVGDI